ncbi:unnamed protein product [Calicophoron daubneyi]|uniref:DUF389 domain-containing protein n=1 Tax=Calicophoron daubneyi TaxID=300641 RepID=A0AAV2TSP5_CALDB
MACLIRVSGPVQPSDSKQISVNSLGMDDLPPAPRELSMERAVQQVLDEEEIVTDDWSTSRNGKFFRVEFSVVGEDKTERILDRLAFFNVGKTDDSSIMVIEPTAYVYKREKDPKTGTISQTGFQEFLRSLKSRLCVAQVYNEINRRGSFDMNYLCFLICAAVIADIALVTNSAGVVFASMLLSPLMDPIMCILFGMNLKEAKMLKKGVKNTAISLFLCVGLGLTFGYVGHLVSNFENITPYPTAEMKQRGQAKSFIASMLVACFSGISVAFATLSRRVAALIGNAISLSLLPPAVNCGQLLLLSMIARAQRETNQPSQFSDTNNTELLPSEPKCTHSWVRNYEFIYVKDECDASGEFALLGAFSFLLVAMNIMLILITGYSVNKLKDMAPRSFTNETVRRFYQKDVPEVRTKYECLHKLNANDLAACAYKEYLRLNHINPETDDLEKLSLGESNRIASDFRAVLRGVQHDQHLQTISACAGIGASDFLKRFVQRSSILANQNAMRQNRTVTIQGVQKNGLNLQDGLNQVMLGRNQAIRSMSVQEALLGSAAALTRFGHLESLGELDCDMGELSALRVPSAKPSVSSTSEHGENASKVGKFRVVPTILSMESMDENETSD